MEGVKVVYGVGDGASISLHLLRRLAHGRIYELKQECFLRLTPGKAFCVT